MNSPEKSRLRPMKPGLFAPLTIREMATIAILVALSMAIKPYAKAIFAPATELIGVPTGVLAGCIYMFWLVLANYLVNKAGSVLILCALQGIVAILLGMTGKLGAMGLLSYLAPGVAVEALFLGLTIFWRYCRCTPVCCMLSGAVANVAGSAVMSALVFGPKPVVMFAGALASAITGAVGGAGAFAVGRRIEAALPSLALGRRSGVAGPGAEAGSR